MNMTDHPHNDPTAVSAGRTEAEAETVPAEPARPPVQRPGPPAHAPPLVRDVVGDPVCWLHEVCPGCGLFIGDDPPPTCPRCGETLPNLIVRGFNGGHGIGSSTTNNSGSREMPAMVDNPTVRVRRVYDEPHPDDGTRVLVDRLWPRGMPKTRARLDQWYPAVAPSTQLRTWYHHEPERFDEFTRRYLDELTQPERADALAHLRDLAENGPLTLLTATKAADISEAAVLAALVTTGPDGSP